MAETSRPWSGTVVGDAGPYTDLEWQELYKSALERFNTSMTYPNVDPDFGSSFAVASPVPGTITVEAGRGWIQGSYYENDAQMVFAVGANTTGGILLRKDYATQTVRMVKVEPYTLVQTPNVMWELIICRYSTIAGVVTFAEIHPNKSYLNTNVDSSMIDDAAVQNVHMDTDSVGTINIKNLNVTTDKMANKAINSQKLGDRAIRLLSRQGNNPTQWEEPGTTDYFLAARTTMMMGKIARTLAIGQVRDVFTANLPETSGVADGLVWGSVERYSEVGMAVQDLSNVLYDPCFVHTSYFGGQMSFYLYRLDTGVGLPQQVVWISWFCLTPVNSGTAPGNPDPSTP